MRFKRDWLVVIFFLLLLMVFFWPVFWKGWLPFPGELLVANYAPWNSYSFLGYSPGGVPHKAQGIDVVRQFFPWKYFSVQMIKKDQLPLWNPYNFAGNPHLANFQTGIFYPLNILFLIFNINVAWSIFILIQPFLAAIFTYLYLREINTSRLAAVFGGVTFAFCLYMTVWLQWGNVGHSLLWLPAVLVLVEKWVKKPTRKPFLLIIFCLSVSILAGYAQATIYLLVLFLVYAYFRRSLKLWWALVLAFGLSAFQILPTVELFVNSARQPYPPEKISELLLPPLYLVTVFVPDFFGNPASRNYWWPGTYIERVSYLGVLPLFLVFFSIFFRRRQPLVRFWLGVAGLTLILTLNLLPVRLFYQLKIPLISTTVYTRLLSIFSFSAAVLAGLGFDFCLGKPEKKKIFWICLIFFSFYLSLWVLVFIAPKIWPQAWWVTYLPVTKRNLILPIAFAFSGVSLLLLFNRFPKLEGVVMGGIMIITITDLFFYFQKITPFSPKEFIYPETELIKVLKEKAGFYRFWGYGSGYIDTNFATQLGVYSPDGYDPLFIRRYGELISTSENGKIKQLLPRSDAALTKGFGKDALRQNVYRQRLLNLLGVKYVLDKDGDPSAFSSEIYQEIWQKNGWRIYENKQVLPRAFLVGDLVVAQGQKIVDLIMAPDFPLDKKVVLEEPLPSEITLGEQSKSVTKIIDYQPNRVVVKTSSPQTGILFLSDNYYPGWRATVNGRPTKIYCADYSFRAVLVPAGENRVVFFYRPTSFFLGLGLALVSLAAIIIIWRKKLVFEPG